MTGKKALPLVVMLIIGIAVGAGGTIAAQKLVFNKNQTTHDAVSTVPKEDGPLVSIGEFTVNLQGGSFLKTSITVEGTDEKAETILVEKEAYMKDRVNTVLSDKSLADVQTAEKREVLRQELIVELNEVTENKIQNVLFMSFVYQ